jgi:hypothetical protein
MPGHRLLLSVLLLSLFGCDAAEPGTAARIQFAETSFDAGRVEQGARVEHRFAFRNGGGRDLRVTRVRPSCDCSIALSSVTVIPPTATAEIAASVDTSGLFGRVTRTVSVFTNDPSAPATLLKLTADVEFDVAADPRQLYVGRVRAGDEVRMQGRIMLVGGTQVTRIEAPGKLFAARLVETAAGSPPRSERRFQVRIAGSAAPGEFTEQLIIHTTSRTTPKLAVPVVGVVEGAA